jgi:hypothetical protein
VYGHAYVCITLKLVVMKPWSNTLLFVSLPGQYVHSLAFAISIWLHHDFGSVVIGEH